MSALYRRFAAATASVVLATWLATACSSSDLVVGDDSRDTPDGPAADTLPPPPDATPPDSSDGDAAKDATGDTKADVTCPELVQPPPGFCDGGPVAPTYNPDGCINGFVCAPVACTAAGGTCVGISPGACPSGHTGDALKYSCGSGIGVQCCLP